MSGQLDKEDVAASQTLRAALTKVEAANPGFTYDLVMGLVRKADVSVNMHESLLRLQGSAGDNDGTLPPSPVQPGPAVLPG